MWKDIQNKIHIALEHEVKYPYIFFLIKGSFGKTVSETRWYINKQDFKKYYQTKLCFEDHK